MQVLRPGTTRDDVGYVIDSEFMPLNGEGGSFTAVLPPLNRAGKHSNTLPQMWIDDPDTTASEGVHLGAKSENQWREALLRAFSERIDRCATATTR